MRKKAIEIVLIGVMMLALAMGGSRADAANSNVFDTLTAEQQAYLTDHCGYTKEMFQGMDEETLNGELLGTGMELYNPSSGVEVFGVHYSLGDEVDPTQYGSYYYDQKCTSERLITYEEALAIRQKENDLRLEDYMQYKYWIKKGKETDERAGYYLYVPIGDERYPDLYVRVLFWEYKDGRIETFFAPLLYYGKDAESDTGVSFSFYYDKPMFDDFYKDPEHAGENLDNLYYGVEYGSVTDHSLVLKIYNCTSSEYTLKECYKLYQVDGGQEQLLKKHRGKRHTILPDSIVRVPVSFGKMTLAPGTYQIEYGEDKEGAIYTVQEFTVEE